MTQEEFCGLTGIDNADGLLKADFANIHTLYMAAGGMGKKDFCEEFKNLLIKERMPKGFEEDKGRCIFYIPLWASEVANTIERLDAEIRRLRAMVKDLEEAAREREEEILATGRDLRWTAGKRGLKELADIAVDLIGAEQSAWYATEKGLVLIKEEEQALTKAMRELTELRGQRDKVTREGERPDAAAAAEADS